MGKSRLRGKRLLAQKLCQHSDKAGGWFGMTAQKLCQGGYGFATSEVFGRKSRANKWLCVYGFLGAKAVPTSCVGAGRRFLGAKAVPTSCVGKSWQQPCPKASNCKAYAIWGFCLPISGNMWVKVACGLLPSF
ncbi:MAG: hypothetical protein RR918_04055, partial [Anaerovoracaceae bacterium]